MGGKIRDTDDTYLGAEGRDAPTEFMVYRGLSPLSEVMVWGTTFKPALKKECQRLGVKIYDRVMATSLLTEGGIQVAESGKLHWVYKEYRLIQSFQIQGARRFLYGMSDGDMGLFK